MLLKSARNKVYAACVLLFCERRWSFYTFRPKLAASAQWSQALGRPLATYDLVVGRYVWGICQLSLPAALKLSSI